MNKQKRNLFFNSDFKTRAEPSNDKKYIEGYFIVFDTETEIFDGYFEKIDRNAIDNSIKNNDIKCLFNHDTSIVLGRVGNGTVSLKADDKGLFASVEINQNDRQAMDIYERVKRGDIATCSFGFFEKASEQETTNNGLVLHNTITEADVFEISICPFPAYSTTEISARANLGENMRFKEHKAKLKIKISKRKEMFRNGTKTN